MSELIKDLKSFIKGDVDASDEAKQFYSHDASMFEMVPEVVVSPKDSKDIQEIVKYVAKNKKSNPSLSLTARSG
ncbi:MAG: FAD-binding oxidoreductase, partial [bacterium]